MNIRVTRAAEGLERRAFTIGDLERMVEAEIIAPDERPDGLDRRARPRGAACAGAARLR